MARPHDRVYMKKLHTWGNSHIWEEKAGEYNHNLHYNPCIAPWGTFHVTAMGKVPLCGQDMDAKMNLGDVTTHSIKEIWQGEKFQEIRRLHAAGRRNEIKFCQGCRLFEPEFSIEESNEAKGYFPVKPLRKAG